MKKKLIKFRQINELMKLCNSNVGDNNDLEIGIMAILVCSSVLIIFFCPPLLEDFNITQKLRRNIRLFFKKLFLFLFSNYAINLQSCQNNLLREIKLKREEFTVSSSTNWKIMSITNRSIGLGKS